MFCDSVVKANLFDKLQAILIKSDLQHVYLQSSSKDDAYKLLDKFMNYFLEVSLQSKISYFLMNLINTNCVK